MALFGSLCLKTSSLFFSLANSSVSQKDAGLLDMLSFLDEVQECLDCASFSPASCLEGIVKADEALRHSQGDSGIQYTILMKRAQLLFTAVSIHMQTCTLNVMSQKQCAWYTCLHCNYILG